MANKTMTFHESYGEVRTSTLRLIKRNNVSPADWDLIDHCMQQMSTAETPQEWWDDVDAHIIACSKSGMYVNLGF